MAEQINKCVSGRCQCQRKTGIHHPVCERQRGGEGTERRVYRPAVCSLLVSQ